MKSLDLLAPSIILIALIGFPATAHHSSTYFDMEAEVVHENVTVVDFQVGLRVDWEQHQANGNNIYWIDPSSRTLVVEHTINVTAISNIAPIIYVSRFDRLDLPVASVATPPPPDQAVSNTGAR